MSSSIIILASLSPHEQQRQHNHLTNITKTTHIHTNTHTQHVILVYTPVGDVLDKAQVVLGDLAPRARSVSAFANDPTQQSHSEHKQSVTSIANNQSHRSQTI
eukprot:3148196-Rhodomonas_salina.1